MRHLSGSWWGQRKEERTNRWIEEGAGNRKTLSVMLWVGPQKLLHADMGC